MADTTPTPADRPADQLRAAAKKLRAAATGLDSAPGISSTWEADGTTVWQGRFPNGEFAYLVADAETRECAELIALMHPGVGSAVARWLESWSGVDLSEHGPMPEDAQHALAVARQLLGTTVAEDAPAEPTPAELIRDQVNESLKDCVWLTVDDEPMALADSWPDARALIDAIHTAAGLDAAPPAPADRAAFEALAAEWEKRGEYGDSSITDRARELRAVLAAGAAAGVQPPTSEARPDDIQVWPLTRVLTEVRCGSRDWTWDEEWADLDQRHAESGYLDRLEQQIRANGITMPVLIGSDGRLWDGHHRLRIAVRLGIAHVPVEITPPAAPAAPEEPQ
ncbi:ParB N-terminal domain-containing protein [Streptomyces rubiginosohelvolus]|uniref:ParB N-terminal domain-containing protein n=1 Tax=Streptomyces rubiginosohelvolus TaxID=67362 RepID=UPI003664B34C